MPRVPAVIVVAYVLFNLAIAGTLLATPGMPPLGALVWANLGIALAARGHEVHFISYEHPFRLPHFLLLALTYWLFFALFALLAFEGAHVGLARADLHTNAGVSAGCAALLVFAAGRDRDA